MLEYNIAYNIYIIYITYYIKEQTVQATTAKSHRHSIQLRKKPQMHKNADCMILCI